MTDIKKKNENKDAHHRDGNPKDHRSSSSDTPPKMENDNVTTDNVGEEGGEKVATSSSLEDAREELLHVMKEKKCYVGDEQNKASELNAINQENKTEVKVEGDNDEKEGRDVTIPSAQEVTPITTETFRNTTNEDSDDNTKTICDTNNVVQLETIAPPPTVHLTTKTKTNLPSISPANKNSSLLTPSETQFLQTLLTDPHLSPSKLRHASTQLSNSNLFPPPLHPTTTTTDSATSVDGGDGKSLRGGGMKRSDAISQSYHGHEEKRQGQYSSTARELQNYLFRIHATSGVRPSVMLKYLEQGYEMKKDGISIGSAEEQKEMAIGMKLLQTRSNSAPNLYSTSVSTEEDEEWKNKLETQQNVASPVCTFNPVVVVATTAVNISNENNARSPTPATAPGGEEYSQSSLSTFDSASPNNHHLSKNSQHGKQSKQKRRVVERGVITEDKCFYTFETKEDSNREVDDNDNEIEDDEGGPENNHCVRMASRMSQGFEIDTAALDIVTASAVESNENNMHINGDNKGRKQQRQIQFQMQQDGVDSTAAAEKKAKEEEEEFELMDDVRTDQEIRPTTEEHIIDEISSWDSNDNENDQEDDVYNHQPDAWDVLKDEYSWGYGYGGSSEDENAASDRAIEGVVSRAAAAAAVNTNESTSLPFKILGTSADDKSCQPHVLSPPLMESIQMFMPESLSECNYWLKFSLSRDGHSLYKLLQTVRGSACTVLAIETTQGHVFGSFTTVPWRANWGYFGGKESFVWRMRRSRLTPCHSIVEQAMMESELEVFPFTDLNNCVQLCRRDKIGLGAREIIDETSLNNGANDVFSDDADTGNDYGIAAVTTVESFSSESSSQHYGFAISLDADLSTGTTSTSETFGNPCLTNVKARGERFEVANIEVWTMTPCNTVERAEREELSRLFFVEEEKKQNDRLNVMSILVGTA